MAVQYIHQNDDGKAILGKVDSNVYGLQLGLKRNSVTASVGYDYIEPNSHSYLNGAPVMPYGHKLSSGDFFAQPLLTSTMDLGAGNGWTAPGAARHPGSCRHASPGRAIGERS